MEKIYKLTAVDLTDTTREQTELEESSSMEIVVKRCEEIAKIHYQNYAFYISCQKEVGGRVKVLWKKKLVKI